MARGRPRSLLLASARVVALAACFAGIGSCSSGTFDQGPSDTLRAYSRAIQDHRIDDAYRFLSDDAKRSISLEAFRRAIEESPGDAVEVAQALSRPTGDPVVTATVSVPTGEELHMVFEGGRWKIDAAAIDLYSQATPRQAIVGFLRAFERKRYDVLLRFVPDAEREGLDDDAATVDVPPEAASAAAPAGSAPAAAPSGSAAPPAPSPAPTAGLPPRSAGPGGGALTAEKLKEAWEGPQKDQMNRIVQALRAALPTATIEEAGETAQMAYGSGSSIALVRERGAWKIKDF
jgi:hypothetical protein